jgi:zinc transporter ZupT
LRTPPLPAAWSRPAASSFYEGARESATQTLIGGLLGAAFVGLAARLLAERRSVHFEALADADARKAILLVGVMTVHSVAEGVGVGVSFGGGESLGVVTTLAIGLHNIPEVSRLPSSSSREASGSCTPRAGA